MARSLVGLSRLLKVNGGAKILCSCRRLRFASSLTPQEAGRQAEAMARSSSAHNKKDKSSSFPALSSIAAHAGIDSVPNAPMAPPIHLATTYTRPADSQYLENDSTYCRQDNPTRLLLEKTVGQLETHGMTIPEDQDVICCAFSSGMMAVSSIILAHSSPVTVILPEDLYHGVPTVIHEVFQRHNVTILQVDMRHPENIVRALESIGDGNEDSLSMDVIVWVETPSNPKCHVVDIGKVCNVVKSSSMRDKATVVVDSTLAPPVITQPLAVSFS